MSRFVRAKACGLWHWDSDDDTDKNRWKLYSAEVCVWSELHTIVSPIIYQFKTKI